MKTIIIDGIEYNLTPKVLLKKGDFVVIQETTYQITKVENLNVTLSLNGRECIFDIDVLKNAHLWTIQDAKDGDVLADGDRAILLFRGVGNNEWSDAIDYYALLETNMNNRFSLQEGDAYWGKVDNCSLCPATKEQRDTLEKAMADAGYTFDFNKKELKEIEQNPAWSEEDEKMLNDILMCGEHHCYLDAGNITWLKSIKDKVQPQQKQEWSEEDSPYYDDICEILINLLRSETANVNKTAVQKDLDWLNSLKPHNTWKPSDEQIKTLEHFVRSVGESGYASPYDNNTKLLYLLLSDLKKLKG